MNLDADSFGIGELSRRTGVGVSTLRAWERRHGFPIPERLAGGHRRYHETHVAAIHDVVRATGQGRSVAEALDAARVRWLAPQASVSATMTRAIPDVARTVLGVETLLAISRAIEDEIAGCIDRPHLFASFQDRRRWRASASRWRDLASTARSAVVMAQGITPRHRGSLWEIALPADAPAAREWTVICDGPSLTVCLVALERPAVDGGPRAFEALWTMEPSAVRAAARTATTIATASAPELAEQLRDLERPAPATATLRPVTRLTTRIFGYLDAARERSVDGSPRLVHHQR